jgi:creatinine amidohydrolase
MPAGGKPVISHDVVGLASPSDLRELTLDGSFGGSYALDDDVMMQIWQTGVDEVRELLSDGWAFQ